MILKQLDRPQHYIAVPDPAPAVAQEMFLAGLGQRDDMLPTPPEGCFLLAAPVNICPSPQPGVLLGSQSEAVVQLGNEYIYAILGGRLAEALLTPILEEQQGQVSPIAATEIARLLRQTKNAVELGLVLGGCRGSGLAYQLVMELLQANEDVPPKNALVERAIALMEENFAHLYGVQELAQSLEVSKSHLIRVFSAEMGITPGQYLTQIRIERAKLFLQAGCYSLEMVAAMSGFSGANYFCKVFRKRTGLTPGQYIHLMGDKNPQQTEQMQQLERELYL